MNDIFLSYAAEDRERAHLLATAFEREGLSVWWDREIPPGKTFDQVIEAELNTARSVVVLWSEHSVKSRWVKTEAAAAADRSCLVPILIDDAPVPFEFRRIQTARLVKWDNPANDPEFPLIVDAIRDIGSRPPATLPRASELSRTPPTEPRASKTGRSMAIAAISAIVVVLIAIMILFNSRTATAPSGGGESTAPDSTGFPPAGPAVPSANSTSPGDAMPVQIGDRISDGKPVAGAGSIEDPFSQDVYVFTARPRQNVFFRMIEHGGGMQFLRWVLADELGMEVFSNCLGCGHPGVRTLVRGGRYTLRVGSTDDPATGIYSVHLIDVPEPDRLPIALGSVVRDDVPARGAGIIESPGVEDVYTFTAPPRQRVYVRVREHSSGVAQLRLRLTDENGMAILEQCLGCGQSGVATLVNGGTYTITVGNRLDPATGTYSFELGVP